MKKLYLSALSVVFTLTCLAQQYQITANISGFPEGTQFLLKNLDVDVNIDSALIRNHSFTMKGNLQDPPLSMWLCTTYKNTFYYLILLMGNDTIYIKGDLKDFPFDLSVAGSRIQDDRNALNELTKGLYGPRTGMITEYLSLKGDSAEIKGPALLQKIRSLDSTKDRQALDGLWDQYRRIGFPGDGGGEDHGEIGKGKDAFHNSLP